MNIRERMKRPYLEQTQQRMLRSSPNNKRKHRNDDSSLSPNPKRRRLLKKSVEESPFFTQANDADPSMIELSKISPINSRNAKLCEDDLQFLQQNGDDIFANSSFIPDYQQMDDIGFQLTSPMIVREPFKPNDNQNKPKRHIPNVGSGGAEEEEIPQQYMDLDSFTWSDLHAMRLSVKGNENETYQNDSGVMLTPLLTPVTYSQMFRIYAFCYLRVSQTLTFIHIVHKGQTHRFWVPVLLQHPDKFRLSWTLLKT